eukprot:10916410-Alexandrium_andersonii.AAC.1
MLLAIQDLRVLRAEERADEHLADRLRESVEGRPAVPEPHRASHSGGSGPAPPPRVEGDLRGSANADSAG